MNRIREIRENKKLSLKKTTELLKSNDLLTLTPDALAKYERGDRQPNEATWQALANFFNVSVDYLKGYMICSKCGGVFIPESGTAREEIKCCPYCMNPYFVGELMANKVDELLTQFDRTETSNPFKFYTDNLAVTLENKNKAYGDSFSKSVDKFGKTVIAVRLSDKFNRICNLIKRGELKENDESLEDTLLDMAGYSILGLKWLKEHENE